MTSRDPALQSHRQSRISMVPVSEDLLYESKFSVEQIPRHSGALCRAGANKCHQVRDIRIIHQKGPIIGLRGVHDICLPHPKNQKMIAQKVAIITGGCRYPYLRSVVSVLTSESYWDGECRRG